MQRTERLCVNRKRVLRVMRERGLLIRPRRLRARRKKEWGRVEAAAPNQIWQSDMTYLVEVIDCCTREIVGWDLSRRCRTEEALAAIEQAVLNRLPAGSRESNLTLTTDNETQFTSTRFMQTLSRLGITHCRTAYHHGRQQLHRTVPSQLEGGGDLGTRISQHRRSACVDRALDRGVQSQSAPSGSAKSNASRGVLSLGSYTTFRGPKRSVLRGAVQWYRERIWSFNRSPVFY